MSKLGIVGAWVALGVGVAAFGCGSGGGGTGASTGSGTGTTSGTTTGTTTSTGSAGTSSSGTSSSSGTGGGTCPIKSAACQMCIQNACPPGSPPPNGWQQFQDCVCAAQLANNSAAETGCVDTFTMNPGASGLNDCIVNSCNCG